MRGKKAPKRDLQPDPKYKSVQIAKFINYIMKGGKKTTAQKIVYQAFDILEKELKKSPLDIFEKAIQNIGPMLEIRGRRIGGANYQIPYPVSSGRRFTLACRWLLEAAKNRKGKPMHEKLALEIIDAYNNTGAAVKKKEDTHRMAEANKAFAHFAR